MKEQSFNTVSSYSNLIKNLLATTYLPLIRSVREGDYICKDRLYILRCEIIKCTKSGYVGAVNFLRHTPLAEWRAIGEYHFGDKDGKLSTCYISNEEGYDYLTHERFGQYLRNLRDMYGLNLMPLYNCFSNQYLENHIIQPTRVKKTSQDNNTKIYKIPIRFNQDYTICIENIGKTTFAPAFIRYNSLLKQNNTKYGNGVDVTNQYISLHKADNIRTEVNTSFGRPIKLRYNNIPETKELLIQDFSIHEKYNLAIHINADDTPSFKQGTTYYEEQIENNKIVYVKTGDTTPYTLLVGDFEDGCAYYIKNGDTFIFDGYHSPDESDESDESGATEYYYVAKNYYVAENVVLAPQKISYEITDEVCSQFDAIEDHLYLLIQVPKAYNQNIVVLEGDYTELDSQKVVDYLVIDRLPGYLYDKFYTHCLNLMFTTSKEPRPFSPALIEFILWNAISNLDTINNDFDRLAIELFRKYIPYTADIHGKLPNYWFDRYRQVISDYVSSNTKNTIQDNIGYVTKDIEGFMYKGSI